jgi:hypothetical protein
MNLKRDKGDHRVMWRTANDARDDDAIVRLCLALQVEDPGPTPVGEPQIRRTLAAFRAHPVRGRALVLDVDGELVRTAEPAPVAVEVEVFPDNRRARALYERLGFAPTTTARLRATLSPPASPRRTA